LKTRHLRDDLKKRFAPPQSSQKMNREVVAKISITIRHSDFYGRTSSNSTSPSRNNASRNRRDARARNPSSAIAKNDDATNEAEVSPQSKMMMDRLNSGADFATLAMDYSEDINSAATGGDLGYVPESSLNHPTPL